MGNTFTTTTATPPPGTDEGDPTRPRRQRDFLFTIAANSTPTHVIDAIDESGLPITLTGKTLRFVIADRASDELAPLYKYETAGQGIVVRDNATNEARITFNADFTTAPGEYFFWLWNITDSVVIASGRIVIEPATMDTEE